MNLCPSLFHQSLHLSSSSSFCLSKLFVELAHYYFAKLSMVLVAHFDLCISEPDFNPYQVMTKMTQKGGFGSYFKNYIIRYGWNLCKIKLLQWCKFFCKNCILGKILVQKIESEILSSTQMAGFVNH